MRILALQLKRIGDLVLTTPALAALKSMPGSNLTLAVDQGTAGLLPAIPGIDAAIVFGRGRGWAPWQQVLTGRYDAVYDFTGSDRSALATALSRASRRVTFTWVEKRRLRALAYTQFVDSPVRKRHTVDHYLDLAKAEPDGFTSAVQPSLIPEARRAREPYAVLHPGTARPEKFWLAARWAEVARHLIETHQLRVVITTGPEENEKVHAAEIHSLVNHPRCGVETPADLCAFATLLAQAGVVISVDTAAVHLAAAFQRPQIALFGPTNPFHWRPRHKRAGVISAVQPDAPLADFTPRMKGAPMEQIPAATVIRAIDTVLSPDA